MWAVEGLVSVCRPEGRKGLELNVIMVQCQCVGNPIAYTPQAQESPMFACPWGRGVIHVVYVLYRFALAVAQ